jgi:hypothetical protein
LPHILGEDDLIECVPELFATSETVHTKIEDGTYTGAELEKAQAFENKLQAFTTTTLDHVERLQADADALLA